MNKEYIRDHGKVRTCDSNVARMTVTEGMYYHIPDVKRMFVDLMSQIVDTIEMFGYVIINSIILGLTTLLYPLAIWITIRRAKKAVEAKSHG